MSKLCDRDYSKAGAYTSRILNGTIVCSSCGHPISEHGVRANASRPVRKPSPSKEQLTDILDDLLDKIYSFQSGNSRESLDIGEAKAQIEKLLQSARIEELQWAISRKTTTEQAVRRITEIEAHLNILTESTYPNNVLKNNGNVNISSKKKE